MTTGHNNWDARFMRVAQQAATWSKDPRAKVGCVLVSPDRRQMSWGFNGFPAGISDDERLTGPEKNDLMIHAELNAILNARRDLTGWVLYVTKFPCHTCALAIIQAGVARVVTMETSTDSKWHGSHLRAVELFREAGVELSVVQHRPAAEPENLEKE